MTDTITIEYEGRKAIGVMVGEEYAFTADGKPEGKDPKAFPPTIITVRQADIHHLPHWTPGIVRGLHGLWGTPRQSKLEAR